MPSKKYHCTNFAVCDRALSKEIIEIPEGGEPDCEHADCRKYLVEIQEGGPMKGIAKKVGLAVAGIAILGILAFFLWPSSPSPEKADTMLSDFFPYLPR
jgi:hypothetical protein